ncbi:translation initiation factor 2A [Nematocida sp. AWRm77]|nr:translation initiation factor 2A [Nematocida sp. AWRm77]
MEMQKPINKVFSVSEEGILFDTFGKDARPEMYTHYKIHQNVVVYSTDTQIIMVDTDTMHRNVLEVSGVKRIEITPDGAYIGVLTKTQQLVIATHTEVVHKVEKVHQFEMSRKYVLYTRNISEEEAAKCAVSKPSPAAETLQEKKQEQKQEQDKPAEQPKPAEPSKKKEAKQPLQWSSIRAPKETAPQAPPKKAVPRGLKALSLETMQEKEKKEIDMHMLAPFNFTVTDKHAVTIKLFKETGGEIEITELPGRKTVKRVVLYNMMMASFVRNTKGTAESLLCLCTLNERSSTYYDKKVLYYFNVDKGIYKSVETENPICDMAFLKRDYFAVCHGNNPNKIVVYSSSLEKVRTVSEGIRNKIFFNQQENIACFAGMNNLPGNMEILEQPSNTFISKNEVVGCSVVDWSPCGTFYLVGITNRMQVDNKVLVFDYYSRKVEEKEFKSLADCRFLGKKAPFKGVEHPPEKIKVENKAAYVPPSLRTQGTSPSCSWVPPHIVTNKEKTKEKKIEALKKELSEVLEIEKRINRGEMIPGGILKIKKKDGLIKKLEQKTKTQNN